MWPAPTNAHEVRRFLGLCSYYRRFVKGFAQITKPLNQLAEFQTTFQCTNECQQAFEDLKKKLCSPPILAFPDPKKQFILDTDASQRALGRIFSQVDNGQEKVIAYLLPPDTNSTRAELLCHQEGVTGSCKTNKTLP